jgi:NAD(P)-dependent dehydrogenase (short-subunit alcohol dehydrogenase family)
MAGLEDLGIECLRLDVCNEESVRACVAQVSLLTKRSGEGESEGILDCLVNNAGGGTSPVLSPAFVQGTPRLSALLPADEMACCWSLLVP